MRVTGKVKTFVLDTNVLLHDPQSIYKFEDNNLAIPVGLTKSYSVYAGVNDANVQWWFGHNAVGAVLTFPILAMFYYFLPKSTGVPIYSHRLSIMRSRVGWAAMA